MISLPVIGINGPGEFKGLPVIYGKTAPGPYLRLKPSGRAGNPSRDHPPLHRLEGLFPSICIQIHPCGMRGHISG
jgi:hypothetical protein